MTDTRSLIIGLIFATLTVMTTVGSLSVGLPEAGIPSIPNSHNEDVNKFVMKLASGWATNLQNRDAAAMANGYTDDAVYYEEGRPKALNSEDIMKGYIAWFNNMGEEHVKIDIEGYEAIEDDMLFVWGVVQFTKNGALLPDLTGKYVTYLRRVSSDSGELDYKIYRDFTFHCK